MRKLVLTFCLTVAVLVGNAGTGLALPECYRSPTDDLEIARGGIAGGWDGCEGAVTYANGDKYVGEFRDGTEHGQGVYTWANGDKYVGEFKNSERHGQGTYTYADNFAADGSKYVGEWEDDERHGRGILTYADGRVKEGIWEKGWFLYAQKVTPIVTVQKSSNSQCRGSPTDDYQIWSLWNDCKGTATFAHGKSKYIGEWRYGSRHGQGKFTYVDGRVEDGLWVKDMFQYAQKVTPTITVQKSRDASNEVKKKLERTENELKKLKKKIARLEKEKKQKQKPRKIVRKKQPKESTPKVGSSGSGFFVSRKGHVITNQHIVGHCRKVTVGDNARNQVAADVVETDRRNDLALLRISSMKMASAETKSLIRKLGIKIVPLSSNGLFRSEDVELGEDVLVSGYPYGEIFSNTIKVTKGIVSANRGLGDDSGQFQMDAAVQPGNSGGPIYDENGNIVGVVVAQLNKMKFAKNVGSIPENVNFGIKASTVRQFLSASGLPTKWSTRNRHMSTRDLAKIARKQTVMVQCHE